MRFKGVMSPATTSPNAVAHILNEKTTGRPDNVVAFDA